MQDFPGLFFQFSRTFALLIPGFFKDFSKVLANPRTFYDFFQGNQQRLRHNNNIKPQTSDKLIFKMIRRANLPLVTRDFTQTYFQYDQRGNRCQWFNDLIHWSEGDLSTCFLPFMCDVKAASSILATLTSLEQ